MAPQHADLSVERFGQFPIDQQILMIGNEMNRAGKWQAPSDSARRKNAYQRALQLVDLTIACKPRHGLLRELLRFRDLLAQLFLEATFQEHAHGIAFRALLLLNSVAARQIRWLAI